MTSSWKHSSPFTCRVFHRKHKNVSTTNITSPQLHNTGSWNPSPWKTRTYILSLHWRHNGCDGVPNHQPHDCLLNRSFRRRSEKTSKIRVTSLCGDRWILRTNSQQRGRCFHFHPMWWVVLVVVGNRDLISNTNCIVDFQLWTRVIR